MGLQGRDKMGDERAQDQVGPFKRVPVAPTIYKMLPNLTLQIPAFAAARL